MMSTSGPIDDPAPSRPTSTEPPNEQQRSSTPLQAPPPGSRAIFTPQPNQQPTPILNNNNPRSPHTGGRAGVTGRRTTAGGALQDETVRDLIIRMDRHGQMLLDKVAPYKSYRWISLTVLLLLFLLRIILLEGFYIVAYVLFIFILNQFILFLQPKDRASLVAKLRSATSSSTTDENNSSSATNNNTNTPEIEQTKLPTLDDEEFRPFVRRLPEFKFWYSSTYATFLAICATFFKAFDVPVFWPLLLFYFIMLLVATMRRQWLDMKTLKYVPWDIGNKKIYKSDPKQVSVSVTTKNTPQQQQEQQVINSSTRAPPPVPTIQITPKKPTAVQSANASTL